MDLLADLTPAQREAVTHRDGPLLVLAGAGSGKTRVVTRRVAHLLRQGIGGASILALTFTNKAAGEMRQRIDALAPGSGVWVGTFHGVCARLLRSYAPRIGIDRGFTIYDQADRLRVLKQVIEQLELHEGGLSAERVEAAISRAKNQLIGSAGVRARPLGDDRDLAAVSRIYPVYQERLRASSAVDFDDLLLHMVTILREHPTVRAELDARFRYVLVDEYQDTNLAQYAVVRALSVDHPNLCVTGDPDQSIYGWRGANLGNILEFEDDFPGCRVVKLERNYRSTKNILRVADQLIRHNRRRKAKALLTENSDGAPVELAVYATEADEARAVAARVVALVREGEYAYHDIAVFFRITALSRGLEAAFRAARIPYQVVGGVSFYERQEVKDVMAYLSLLANPKDDLAFQRVANVPPRGLGKTSLEHLAARAGALGLPLLAMARQAAAVPGLTPRAAAALRDFTLLVDELAALRDHPAEEVIRTLLTLTGYRDHLRAEARGDGEDRLANLDELISAAREFDRDHPGGTIVEFLEAISLTSAVDRWKDEDGAVALMTLHAAKGLEFPVVFLIGLEQGLLPHARAGSDDHEQEEERRLLFVGITRAERELYLSHCRVREFRGQKTVTVPSSFLDELPPDAMRTSDFATGSAGASSAGRYRGADRAAPPRHAFRLTTAAELGGALRPAHPVDLDAFRPGVSVFHPQYGIGRIVAIEGAGPQRKGKVAFPTAGERTFVLAQSPLRPVT
jgi:DNA helicase-2/ATP-dependent DNA helicase PcrA